MTSNKNSATAKKGSLFIISAASGTGKTTLVQAIAGISSTLLVSVSHTTRARRSDEGDGVAYHFVNEETFSDMVKQDLFLEHATVFGHQYGTSREWVEEQLETGNDVILEIDWQGAQQVKSKMPDVVSIFLLPPSYQSLEQRLFSRGEDNEDTIKQRMQEAKKEISHYKEFGYIVINDEFDRAFGDLVAMVRTVSHSRYRHPHYFDNFVKQLVEEGDQIQ